MSGSTLSAQPRLPYAFITPLEGLERRTLLSAGLPPKVVAAAFEFEKSHAVVMRFDQNVGASLGGDDIAVVNVDDNTVFFDADVAVSFRDGDNAATFTFPNLKKGLLPDGNYRVMLFGGGVFGPSGEPMESNFEFKFRFLRGDVNGDAKVDLSDFNTLAGNFGRKGATFSQGDFNYDGRVDLQDFDLLAAQFGEEI
jgi:hypothetical protein